METRNQFSKEELELAKQVDLVAVAEHLGYTPKRIGQYVTLKEMSSIRIYNRTHWFRWSRRYEKKDNGGSQIDFLCVFADMEVKEAVFWLLDFVGYRKDGDYKKNIVKLTSCVSKVKVEQKKPFVLPIPSKTNDYLYSYLLEKRAISREVIDYFVNRGLIYEAKAYHNIVFKGNDKDGNTRFASMRGVFDRDGKGFQCDVEGNDKNYGFHMFYEESDELVVFEAAIDLLSYMDIFWDFQTSKLAMGMLFDAPIVTFLKEHPQVKKIRFCCDNDEPGRKVVKKMKEKYESLSYEVFDSPPPKPYKDYNEWLVESKRLLREVRNVGLKKVR